MYRLGTNGLSYCNLFNITFFIINFFGHFVFVALLKAVIKFNKNFVISLF